MSESYVTLRAELLRAALIAFERACVPQTTYHTETQNALRALAERLAIEIVYDNKTE